MRARSANDANKTKEKKKKSSSSSSKAKRSNATTTTDSSAPQKSKTQMTMASFLAAVASSDDPEHANALELARRVGLPAGWTAVTKSNYAYDVQLPCGRHRFRSREAVFTFVAANPSSFNNNNDDNTSNPRWSTTEHGWLGWSMRWEQGGTKQTGTVTGWLSETDVDSAGAPAFCSESNG